MSRWKCSLLLLGCLVIMAEGNLLATEPLIVQTEGTKLDYRNVDSTKILKLVLTDWMTNPEVKSEPYSYLIDPEKPAEPSGKVPLRRLLIDKTTVPQGFKLKLEGVKVKQVDLSQRDLKQGEMSIRILEFRPQEDGSFHIQFLHSGYSIIGGDFVTYKAAQVDNQWQVEFVMAFDP